MMTPNLNYLLAKATTADLMRAAEQARVVREARAVKSRTGTLDRLGQLLVPLRAAKISTWFGDRRAAQDLEPHLTHEGRAGAAGRLLGKPDTMSAPGIISTEKAGPAAVAAGASR
jgi:hypothetical protein